MVHATDDTSNMGEAQSSVTGKSDGGLERAMIDRGPARSPAVWLQPELYRIRDAAAVLGVSERMVYSFIELGALVAIRLPSTGTKRAPVRIARADLLGFIERHRGVRA